MWNHCTLVLLQQDFLRSWNPDPCCHKVIFFFSPVFGSLPSNNTYSDILFWRPFFLVYHFFYTCLIFCFFVWIPDFFHVFFRSHLLNLRNCKKIKNLTSPWGKPPVFPRIILKEAIRKKTVGTPKNIINKFLCISVFAI